MKKTLFLLLCSVVISYAQYVPAPVTNVSQLADMPITTNILIGDGNGGINAAGIAVAPNLGVTSTAIGNSGPTPTPFNPALAGMYTITLNANATVTFSLTWPASGAWAHMAVRILQDGTGGRTVTWPGAVVSAPQINPTANSITYVTLDTTDAGSTVYAHSDYAEECIMCLALSDETTALTTGTAKVTMRAPFAFTITNLRLQLGTASSSGLPTVDIKEAGTTIFSTELTIDANELTSVTAATPFVLSDTSIADDAVLTFNQDVSGTSAKSEKICIFGHR